MQLRIKKYVLKSFCLKYNSIYDVISVDLEAKKECVKKMIYARLKNCVDNPNFY